MIYETTTHDVTVSVKVQYVPRLEMPSEPKKWFWTYEVTLKNASNLTMRLKTRHWRIMDAKGRIQIVDGEGVVGETPLIRPSETYSYASGCPLDTPSGAMSGHYMFVTDDGQWLKIEIPDFSLDMPDTKRTLN
jgi:ApaG protein